MNIYKVRAIVLVGVAFILGLSEFIIIGLVSTLAPAFSTSESSIGLLVTSFALIYAVCTPIINILIGSKLLHRVLLFLMLIFEIGNIGTALATSYNLLFVSRIITAVVSGAIISIAITFGSILAPKENRATLISWIFSGFSLASVFGVPLGTLLSRFMGWRSVFFIISFIGIIIMILLYLVLPHNIRQGTQIRLKSQLKILGDRKIQLGLLLPMLNLAAIYSFYTYISPIVLDKMHFGFFWLTPILFMYGLMSLVGNLQSGTIAKKSGLQTLIFVFLTQCLLLVLLPLFFSNHVVSISFIMILGFTISLLNSPIQLHFMDIAEHHYPQSLVLASSFNSIFSNIGIALGSACASWTFETLGLSAVAPAGSIFAFGAFIVTIILVRQIKMAASHK